MLELLRKKKSLRILIVAGAAIAALAGAVYLYFHNPHSYPLPCVFYSLTGFYCPGCGAGRASYSLLHGRFLDAFCYNPVMTVLLPLLALYVAARAIDWAITDVTKTVPSSRERTRSRIRFVYPLSTIPPPFMSRILYIIRDMIAIGPIPLILSVPIKNLIYTSKIKNFARQYSFHICHIFIYYS